MAPLVKASPIPAFRRTKHTLSSKFTACLSLALMAHAAPLTAQQPLPLPEAALRGQTLFDQSASTGMVLVVVRNNEVLIKGYGETSPGSGHTPDANSEVRLCSISKIFAGDLLTRLAAAGTVSLSDPLQRYAPPRSKVPDGPGGRPITLEDLALHTSGLPREVLPYPAKAPHFTFPGYTTRWAWLPKQKLAADPGTVALYSNVGFDLLGDALAAASGKSYASLLHETLLQPLDMWDTTLVPSKDQCARLLQPIKDEGPCTETLASGASSGVYSTPTDMVKLLKYLLHAPGSAAQPAAALSVHLKPAQLKSVQGLSHAGDPTGIGLGWVQLGDPATPSALMEKTGGGAGFTTYIALSPNRQTGIFLAATWGRGDAQIDVFHEANNLLAALANVPPLPPRTRPAPAVKKHAKRRRRAAAPVP
jgi:D-alanyl-D-alanine-carboxypeptidase/D-alanyl-D-alanine-endopeptidase